jgi:hypothetical protein
MSVVCYYEKKNKLLLWSHNLISEFVDNRAKNIIVDYTVIDDSSLEMTYCCQCRQISML